MDEFLKEMHGITREIKIVLKKLSLHNVTIPNIEESEDEEDSINLLGKRNAIKNSWNRIIPTIQFREFLLHWKKLVKLITFIFLDTTDNLMGYPDEKVKSPEKETGSGSTNRLYMYHQRRANFSRNEEENPSDTENSKKEGNHSSEIRGLCLMKLSC